MPLTSFVHIFDLHIKIRPLWDWNSCSFAAFHSHGFIKIRPLWDWNIDLKFLDLRYIKLK